MFEMISLPSDDHRHQLDQSITITSIAATSQLPSNIIIPHHLHGNPCTSTCFPFDPYQDHHFLNAKTTPVLQGFERSIVPWSSDEILALHNLRSQLQISFPDFTVWDHISRKLGELGFKRSAEECRGKFAEEGKNTSFKSVITDKSHCKMLPQELDELYNHPTANNDNQDLRQKTKELGDDHDRYRQDSGSTGDGNIMTRTKRTTKKSRKQRREDKLEMVRGFLSEIVERMISQQEEMCGKLIESMFRKDEEKFAREEAWKKEDMDRVAMEIELSVREQAIAGERQATMIKLLKNLSSSSSEVEENPNNQTIISKSPSHPNPIHHPITLNNPSWPSISDHHNQRELSSKRWPKEEIHSLINLRCKMMMMNRDEGSGSSKGPLWERISQGMGELGYKRSAKRCKEKWENINKYFRKTKDSSNMNKRSGGDQSTRTCPYFHQLSCLYSDGTLQLAPNSRHL